MNKIIFILFFTLSLAIISNGCETNSYEYVNNKIIFELKNFVALEKVAYEKYNFIPSKIQEEISSRYNHIYETISFNLKYNRNLSYYFDLLNFSNKTNNKNIDEMVIIFTKSIKRYNIV